MYHKSEKEKNGIENNASIFLIMWNFLLSNGKGRFILCSYLAQWAATGVADPSLVEEIQDSIVRVLQSNNKVESKLKPGCLQVIARQVLRSVTEEPWQSPVIARIKSASASTTTRRTTETINDNIELKEIRNLNLSNRAHARKLR
jgi:hypothetical protein